MQTNEPPRYGAPISLDDAKYVMQAAEAEAVANGWPAVIAIADSSGHLVMLHKLDNAQHGSIAIAQMKAECAVNFRRSTKAFDDAMSAGALRLLALPGVIAAEGGLPLLRGGNVIGAIGVSGLLASQDAMVAEAGVRALSDD
jgi:uncharacterized protein GlcG (DUF336 family)